MVPFLFDRKTEKYFKTLQIKAFLFARVIQLRGQLFYLFRGILNLAKVSFMETRYDSNYTLQKIMVFSVFDFTNSRLSFGILFLFLPKFNFAILALPQLNTT